MRRAKGNELSENTAGTGSEPDAVDRSAADGDAVDGTVSNGDSVLRFVGGPLDGRVEVRSAQHGAPLPTITHVHLHDGPKVVHRYDLEPLTDEAAVYTVRPRARRSARDDAVAD